MARFLIFTGVILLVAGLLWPLLTKLGLGRVADSEPRAKRGVVAGDEPVETVACMERSGMQGWTRRASTR